jgi:riboflavin synthase
MAKNQVVQNNSRMFSGIVEAVGKLTDLKMQEDNIDFYISSPFLHELKIDQSVAHNGACLTVVELLPDSYRVTAIAETLQKTNLSHLKKGDSINLERCLKLNERLDGHMVQGHVDTTATCVSVHDENGSWKFVFRYSATEQFATVPKGSICVNGVSLTVVDSDVDQFSVCIIPFTFEHTNFSEIKAGDRVNLEFDIIGKYVLRYLSTQNR